MTSIDQNTVEQVRWYLRYEEHGEDTSDLSEMFSAWWKNRNKSPSYLIHGRKFWQARWRAMVELERRNIALQHRSRCPTCGARLSVRHCLACDLEGMQL